MRLRRLLIAAAVLGGVFLGVPAPVLAQPSFVPCNGPALQDAVEAANTGGGGTLRLTPGCDYVLTEPRSLIGNGNGPNGFVQITTTIRINGNGATISRSSSATAFRFFWVEGGDLTLNKLTLRGGHLDSGDGGAIYIPIGSLTLFWCIVTGNSVSDDLLVGEHGGGIMSRGTLTVNDSVISHNTARDGGGLDAYGEVTTTINRSLITGNRATHVGGGLEALSNGGTFILNDSMVTNNEVNGPGAFGGGILSAGGFFTMNNSSVWHNSVTGDDAQGGGIWNGAALVATGSSFIGNTVTGTNARGGGIFNHDGPGGSTSLKDAIVTGNRAVGSGADGGGIYRSAGTVTLTRSLVRWNQPNNCGSPSTVPACP